MMRLFNKIYTIILFITLCMLGHSLLAKKGKALPSAPPFKPQQEDQSASIDKLTVVSTVRKALWLHPMVIPGQSAGKAVIHGDFNEVLKWLGNPHVTSGGMGRLDYTWYANLDATEYIDIYGWDLNNLGVNKFLIKQIYITSPLCRTESGINVGSSLQEIEAHYELKKAAKDELANIKPYILYYAKDGLAFIINAQDICIAMVVYEVGEKVLPGLLKTKI